MIIIFLPYLIEYFNWKILKEYIVIIISVFFNQLW